MLEYLDLFFPENEITKLEFKIKYGFDGTNANSYNQKWTDDNIHSDNHIFCSSIVPLQLENKKNHVVLWRNPHPSSSRFCRPIRIQYVRETAEVSKEEENYLKHQIKNLKDFEGKNICYV